MIKENIIFTFAFLFLFQSGVSAQKAERSDIRKGNGFYNKNQYTEAEIEYRKGIEVNPRSMEGIYNLGNTLYRQEKFPEAAEQYQLLAGQGQRLLQENPKNAEKVSQIFHNVGNIGMKTKEYQKSVDAYKQALRLNPKDDETRYNLALAQKLLSDQQQEQQQDQDKDDQKDDQNKDEQKKDDQQQQDQQNQDQQQQQQEKENQQQKTQEQPQQNEQMSRDNAQQMLDAFLQDEKDTQEKVKKIQMQQQKNRKREKQW
ncbi:MAG: tetratricopeptide repeat protein [Tannerella sp.]|jgi:tetratricopeptide (TPR) repeat protein|nr:tetratricopeptide repeat protein [Tannerella sp.]